MKHLAIYVPLGNIARLENSISTALLVNRKTSHLVEQAETVSGFDKCGKHAIEILETNFSITKPVGNYKSLLRWGPFSNEQAFALPAVNLKVPYPIFVNNATSKGNWLLIELKAIFQNTLLNVSVDTEILQFQRKTIHKSKAFPGWNQYTILFKANSAGSGTITFFFNEGLFHREIFKIMNFHSPNYE